MLSSKVGGLMWLGLGLERIEREKSCECFSSNEKTNLKLLFTRLGWSPAAGRLDWADRMGQTERQEARRLEVNCPGYLDVYRV